METIKDQKIRCRELLSNSKNHIYITVVGYYFMTTIVPIVIYQASNALASWTMLFSLLYSIAKFLLCEMIILKAFSVVQKRTIEWKFSTGLIWAFVMSILEIVCSLLLSIISNNFIIAILISLLLPFVSMLYLPFQNIFFYNTNKKGRLCGYKEALLFLKHHIMNILSVSVGYYFLNLGYNYAQNYIMQSFHIEHVVSKYDLFLNQDFYLTIPFILLELVFILVLSRLICNMFVAYADLYKDRRT